jgi:CheY-like chemotaxis protein
MAMPVMGGAECFRALRARAPELSVLLVSGYTMEEDAQRCLREGARGFLDKPYTIEQLATAVAGAVARDAPVSAAG